MSPALTAVLICAVGAQLAMQAPVNGGLGRYVGRLSAALISFFVGTVILLVVCAAAGDLGRLGGLADIPLSHMVGGLMGATYVATATITVGRLGAGAVAAATITGQLTSSLAVDQFAWAGVEQESITALRALGAVLLFAGMLLIVRRRDQSPHLKLDGAHLAALGAMFFAGLLVGVQHPLNAQLSDSIGELPSGLMNFVVGTTVLALIVLLSGKARDLAGARQAPPHLFVGGLLGVITVVASLAAVPVIGAAGLTAALVTGQLVGSVALDRIGAFGLEVRYLTPVRVVGAVTLVAGTMLAIG